MFGLLIADDERLVRQSLKQNICWAKYGFQVLGEAKDGQETLRLLRQLRPHLLITDIRMPNISGVEVMARARMELPNLQIIVLSAFDSFEYARQALLYSAVGYLLKPVKPDQLDVLMEKVIAQLRACEGAQAKKAVVDSVVERALAYMEENYMQRLTLEQTAAACYANASYLSSAFKNAVGISFTDYLSEMRIRKARVLLENSQYRINEIAARVGYDDYSYFCRVFKKLVGVAPLRYRMGERGAEP